MKTGTMTVTSWLIWPFALALILPLMRPGPKLRVWLVLLLASSVSWWFYGPIPYLIIDLAAAFWVTNKPRRTPQRAIGGLFVGMALFHIGFLLSSQVDNGLYIGVLQTLSWLQLAILAGWGAHDALRVHYGNGGPVRSLLAASKARIR